MKKENPYNDFWSEVGGSFLIIITFLCMIAILGLICSCSPKGTPIETSKHDTTYIKQIEYQNIIWKDSVFVTEKQKGDTIYIDKYRQVIAWRDKETHDTVYKASVDTITVKEVEYKQTRKDVFFGVMGRLFVWLIGGLFLWIAFWLFIGRKMI